MTTPAARATVERSPSAPTTTDACTVCDPSPNPSSGGSSADHPGRQTEPDVDPGSDRAVEEHGIERRPVETDGRGVGRATASVGERDRRCARRFESQLGIGCASPDPTASTPRRRNSLKVAGELNTPHARQRYVGCRSNSTTSRPARASAIPSAAPAGPPPTIATSRRSVVTPAAAAIEPAPRSRRIGAARAREGPAGTRGRRPAAVAPPQIACTRAGPRAARRCACSVAGATAPDRDRAGPMQRGP